MKETIIKLGEVAVKRFYVPIEVHEKCPKCNHDVVWDGEEDYLSYPNGEEVIEFYCDNCDNDFTSKKTIEIVGILRDNDE